MSAIVVIAASAGGVLAIQTLLSAVPTASGASIFVVLHVGEKSSGVLPSVLGQRSHLPVSYAHDRTRFLPGHVYVAPGNHHMTLEADRIRLNQAPPIHHTRPAADPLFMTAAATFGRRVAGVVLTGYDHDGAAGLLAIKTLGGMALVQDPREAEAPYMPRAALALDHPDPLRIGGIARRLTAFCARHRMSDRTLHV